MLYDDGQLRRSRHRATGNAVILVVINGKANYWNRCFVDETFLSALEHYGMPYRVLDLALERPSKEVLANCAGLILAQSQVAGSLSESEAALISAAVKAGVGLVNFDHDLLHFPRPLLEMFGFSRINPHPFTTDVIRIRTTDHYITGMQYPGEYHKLDRMVSGTIVEELREGVTALADGLLGKDQLIYVRHVAPSSAFEPRNYPVLFAAQWGKGKAVQFTLSSNLWRREFFGHGRGIDDLFWRSIIWSVRKPFAANVIPPFVTLSIDDCSGRNDFSYVEIANKHGFTPLIALFLKTVPERLNPIIKIGMDSQKVQYTTHALDYNTSLAFNFGKGECTKEELDERFAYDDAWWQKVGTRPGATIRPHWGEWGVNALSYCKARGRIFFDPGLQTGLLKADMCMTDGFWPFHLQSYYYDFLPDDPDFYGFSSLGPRHQEDFLSGCTAYLGESGRTDVEKAAQKAALRIAHGLRGCFHAELLTHEQKFDALTVHEWDQILNAMQRLTEAFGKTLVSHDHIGHYLKGKDSVWIERADVHGSQVCCKLSGKTATPLQLSIFRDDGDSVSREYTRVDPFNGSADVG